MKSVQNPRPAPPAPVPAAGTSDALSDSTDLNALMSAILGAEDAEAPPMRQAEGKTPPPPPLKRVPSPVVEMPAKTTQDAHPFSESFDLEPVGPAVPALGTQQYPTALSRFEPEPRPGWGEALKRTLSSNARLASARPVVWLIVIAVPIAALVTLSALGDRSPATTAPENPPPAVTPPPVVPTAASVPEPPPLAEAPPPAAAPAAATRPATPATRPPAATRRDPARPAAGTADAADETTSPAAAASQPDAADAPADPAPEPIVPAPPASPVSLPAPAAPDSPRSTSIEPPASSSTPTTAPVVSEPPTPPPPAVPARTPQTPVKLLSSGIPEYPRELRNAKVGGTVTLRLQIDAAGRVTGSEAISGPEQLRLAAQRSVRQWRYQPATLNGVAVASETTVNFVFDPNASRPKDQE